MFYKNEVGNFFRKIGNFSKNNNNKKLLTKYDYVYKFKIINIKLNKNDIKISKNDDIEIPINELNNLYYIQ